jgi:hypothetical protein
LMPLTDDGGWVAKAQPIPECLAVGWPHRLRQHAPEQGVRVIAERRIG